MSHGALDFPLPLFWRSEPGASATLAAALACLLAALFFLYRSVSAACPVVVRVWKARVACGRRCGGMLVSGGALERVANFSCLRIMKIVVGVHLHVGPAGQSLR